MKRYLRFLRGAAILVALALAVQLLAGTTYDHTVKKDEGAFFLRYYGDVDMSSDATGTHFTQAFLIGNANLVDGKIYIVASEAGTEDVDVFLEYSDDRKNWSAGTTDSDLNAVGTTAVVDTIGMAAGVDQWLFHNSKWARFKMVGQAGNGQTTVSWSVTLHKHPDVYKMGVGDVGDKR